MVVALVGQDLGGGSGRGQRVEVEDLAGRCNGILQQSRPDVTALGAVVPVPDGLNPSPTPLSSIPWGGTGGSVRPGMMIGRDYVCSFYASSHVVSPAGGLVSRASTTSVTLSRRQSSGGLRACTHKLTAKC